MKTEGVIFASTDSNAIFVLRAFLRSAYADNGNLPFLEFDGRDCYGYTTATFIFNETQMGANGILSTFTSNGCLNLLDNIIVLYYIKGTGKVAVLDRYDVEASLHWVATVNPELSVNPDAEKSSVPFHDIITRLLECMDSTIYQYLPLAKDAYDDKLVISVVKESNTVYIGDNMKPVRSLADASLYSVKDFDVCLRNANTVVKAAPTGASVLIQPFTALCKSEDFVPKVLVTKTLNPFTYYVSDGLYSVSKS